MIVIYFIKADNGFSITQNNRNPFKEHQKKHSLNLYINYVRSMYLMTDFLFFDSEEPEKEQGKLNEFCKP